jgi:hypothetical protein
MVCGNRPLDDERGRRMGAAVLEPARGRGRPVCRGRDPAAQLRGGTGTGRSFGERRCRLFADALVRSHESGLTDQATVLVAVEERFAEAAVDLDAAHLSADPAIDLGGAA